jgi:S1-C subfamily serine protease
MKLPIALAFNGATLSFVFNGKEVPSAEQLRRWIMDTPPGTEVLVEVARLDHRSRELKFHTLKVKLSERPPLQAPRRPR